MAATIDEQFVEFVVKSLVNHPDEVKIDRTVDERGVFLQLRVHPEDVGRVIGKGGATAQSIRKLLWALGTKNQAKYNFKIVDEREGEAKPPTDDSKQTATDGAEPAKVEATKTEVVEAPAETTVAVEETSADTENLTKKTLDDLKDLDDLDI